MHGSIRYTVVALVAAAWMVGAASHAQEAYRIVVNVQNPVEGLTKADAARFFLTRAAWDTGEAVYPVDLTTDSAVREAFSREVLGMSPAAATEQWRKRELPPAMATDREVLAFVRLKRGAIGYVSASAKVDGVKVVPIVRATSR